MTTLQAEPRIIAKKKYIGTAPHLPDPVATVEKMIEERHAEAVAVVKCKPMPYHAIASEVCNTLGAFHDTEYGVVSKCRHERVVLAREIITVLCRQFTMMSFPEIARAMGRPNHSTVITAFQRFEKTQDVKLEWGYICFSKAEWLNLCRSKLFDRFDPRPM
jgi:hypothetical protein